MLFRERHSDVGWDDVRPQRALLALAACLLSGCDAAGPGDEPLVFKKVAVGFQWACGLTIDGEGYCWGQNRMPGRWAYERPTPLPTVNRFFDLGSGAWYACGLAVTDSTPHCWGQNYDAGAGHPPLQRSTVRLRSLHVGGEATMICGTTTANIAYCMGRNERGQAGVGHELPVVTMTPVQTGASVSELQSSDHACLVTTNGLLECWGNNWYGALGIADTAMVCDPVPSCYRNLPQAVSTPGVTFAHVTAGLGTSCALTPEGEAWCWGDNGEGTVGAPATDTCWMSGCNPRPTRVSGGLRFRSLRTDWGITCGVTLAGEGYCWGRNESGQLGVGDLAPRATPTRVLGDLVFQDIVPGSRHTCGLTVTGAAYCWGHNSHGALGKGTLENRVWARPQRVVGP